jgi:hypothetical protein
MSFPDQPPTHTDHPPLQADPPPSSNEEFNMSGGYSSFSPSYFETVAALNGGSHSTDLLMPNPQDDADVFMSAPILPIEYYREESSVELDYDGGSKYDNDLSDEPQNSSPERSPERQPATPTDVLE